MKKIVPIVLVIYVLFTMTCSSLVAAAEGTESVERYPMLDCPVCGTSGQYISRAEASQVFAWCETCSGLYALMCTNYYVVCPTCGEDVFCRSVYTGYLACGHSRSI